MADEEKPGAGEEIQIDRQKIVKGSSKPGSGKAGQTDKVPAQVEEIKTAESTSSGGPKFRNLRFIFATLVLFSVGTVWLVIGISEKEVLGSVLGGVFLLLGFLSAATTFGRKSA